jgi:hypothetical protein
MTRIEGSGSREIIDRLYDIKSLLERQNQNVAALSAEVQSRPSRAEIAAGMTRLLHGYPWIPPEEGGPDPWVR